MGLVIMNSFPAPPAHQLASGAIVIRARHPLVNQMKMRAETLPEFGAGDGEGRFAVADDVIHREVGAAGLEPAAHSLNIGIALRRLDGAEQGVLEDVVEGERRLVVEKVREGELSGPTLGRSREGGALVGVDVREPFVEWWRAGLVPLLGGARGGLKKL